MKVQRIRERDATSGNWGGDWRTWLRVSRLDIEPLGIEVTSASSKDANYLYLHGDDIETFYVARRNNYTAPPLELRTDFSYTP